VWGVGGRKEKWASIGSTETVGVILASKPVKAQP
jgi:hypothetical protein